MRLKKKSKEPFIPIDRQETIRQKIISALKGQTLSVREISVIARITDKEVHDHLDHIKRSINKRIHSLIIMPAECRKCGFVFRKREKLKKPGKCPVCRSETIKEQLFSIR